MSIGKRIADRISELRWSQSKLAKKISVSQPVISAYVNDDKRPSRQTLELIARELDVPVDYLLSGALPQGRLAAMSTPPSELAWNEREAPDDGTRSYGNARAELFRLDNELLAGESGQNSNDASMGQEVTMEYRLGALSGVYLERFLAAIQWDVLRPHYESVAADQHHRTAQRYERALSQLDGTGKLWVLRIDDYGTTGLIGSEYEPGCFSGLVRFSQHSQKKNESSGGRFGLGSASLSSASGFDLVVFLSDLSEPVQGKTEGRLIGRAVFPYHELAGGVAYEGPFFFGVPGSEHSNRRDSAWSSPELRQQLWMERDRALGNTGTSVLIVGYSDPSATHLDARAAEESIRALADAFENRFWPAIARGRLSARFTRYENERQVSERILDAERINQPFVALFSDDESIVERTVPLHVPASSDGEAASDHTARLLVQLLPDDRLNPRSNELAMMRGALMVVKYRRYPDLVLGAKPFRAALLCGEGSAQAGQSPNPADRTAELFFAKAEPPQHNDWTSRGTDLTADYYGGKAQLDRFFEAVRTTLREVVTPERRDDSLGPEALRRLLSIPVPGRPQGKKAEIVRLEWRDAGFRTLAATVRLNFRKDRDRVALRPQAYVSTDSGGGIDLPVRLEAASGSVLVAQDAFSLDSSARDAIILLHPDWSAVPVRPDLSALRVDVTVIDRSEIQK